MNDIFNSSVYVNIQVRVFDKNFTSQNFLK